MIDMGLLDRDIRVCHSQKDNNACWPSGTQADCAPIRRPERPGAPGTVDPVPPASEPDLPRFLAACRGLRTDRVPVWFMRQAGRSLPEYRRLRGTGSILDAVRDPALAAEITLQPVRRYGVDAAILFSDIVVPVAAIGFGVEVRPGVGPVVERPFATPADLGRLRELHPDEDLPWVAETVRLVAAASPVPVIGFAGAPFTVASYLVEGGPSRDHEKTKSLMYRDPGLWAALLERLAAIAVASLRAQVAAGARAIQLFDSWVGALSPADYRRHVLPATRFVLQGIDDLGVPRILFGVGTGELLSSMADAGPEVIGVDWRVPLGTARQRVGPQVALQGNLDPVVCLASWDVVRAHAEDVLSEGCRAAGYVFNLGHGVLPGTDPDTLARLVDLVHSRSVPPA
jgi:uroporphyrinogen decarboxylase